MGLFDFVENFFFIGLALLFVLVLLLVYHFKQRMNSVEKKGDNMFDLLTNVVRELRNIRTNIGGSSSSVADPGYAVKKMEPEMEEDEDDEDDEGVGAEYETIEEDSDEESDDGITYQIIDTKEKVVVSDESDTDTDDESNTETEDESEGSDMEEDVPLEMDVVETTTAVADVGPVVPAVPVPAADTFTEDIPLEMDDVNAGKIPVVESFSEDVDTEIQCEEVCEISTMPIEEVSMDAATDDIQPISRAIGANQEKLNSYKKMNVIQLKALAIQAGIQGDTSKLKKTALIDILLEKQG